MAELQQLAASMGLKGISRMRKSELITAIRHSDRTAALLYRERLEQDVELAHQLGFAPRLEELPSRP